MVAKRQKPPHLLQGHRKVPGLIALPTRTAAVEVPPLPEVTWPDETGAVAWHEMTRAQWAAIWQSSIAQMWDRAAAMPALSRYVIELDRWYRYNELVLRVPLVKGSKGQMRENPLATRMAMIAVTLRGIEEKFGLTPLDAMRLGYQMGEAAEGMQRAAEILENSRYDDDDFGAPDGWEVSG